VKDIYEVLRRKEVELVRVYRQVNALKLIIPLLQDDEPLVAEGVKVAQGGPKEDLLIIRMQTSDRHSLQR
jgi:hypothetical protein